jgi:hypothetical protein
MQRGIKNQVFRSTYQFQLNLIFFIYTQKIKLKKYGTLHDFACHPCAGAMLIFSVSFQF